MRPALEHALEHAKATVRWTTGFAMPAFRRDMRFVAMKHPREYPFNDGRIVSNDGIDLPLTDWTKAFEEFQVEGTNALHARSKDGKGPYLLGPAARVSLCADQLHPVARALLEETGMQDMIRTNIYASIVARAVELVHAIAEALDIIDAYRPPESPAVEWRPRAGVAAWATEAPRGMLLPPLRDRRGGPHRPLPDRAARRRRTRRRSKRTSSTPPTTRCACPTPEATHRLEQMIRSYDPCISCATHFLDLSIEADDRAASPRCRDEPAASRSSSAATRTAATTAPRCAWCACSPPACAATPTSSSPASSTRRCCSTCPTACRASSSTRSPASRPARSSRGRCPSSRRSGASAAGTGRRAKSRSSHELPLEQALALAEELRQHPIDGWFLGIGIADCELGDTLSPAVVAALPALAATPCRHPRRARTPRGGAAMLTRLRWARWGAPGSCRARELQTLLDLLQADGRKVIGPTVVDGAIVCEEIATRRRAAHAASATSRRRASTG